MKSPFEKLEEFLFKRKRTDLFETWTSEIQFTEDFKKLVKKTNCPACDKPLLKVRKFERGPKGYEAEIICEGCIFHALINSRWTLFENVDSKGRAREK